MNDLLSEGERTKLNASCRKWENIGRGIAILLPVTFAFALDVWLNWSSAYLSIWEIVLGIAFAGFNLCLFFWLPDNLRKHARLYGLGKILEERISHI